MLARGEKEGEGARFSQGTVWRALTKLVKKKGWKGILEKVPGGVARVS